MTHRSRWTMLALGITLTPLAAKVLSPAIAFPFWDSDPLLSEPIAVGLRPVMSVFLDVMACLGAALLVATTGADGRRAVAGALLFLLGCVPVLWFAFRPGDMDQARIGLSWASAMAAGTAIWLVGPHDERVRRVTIAVFGGLIAALVLKGAGQLLVEHPEVVKNFRENRLKILEGQGWLPDSPMAKGYERRLMQAEATGWFGFSNIFASYAAALAALWAGVTVAVWTARQELTKWHVSGAIAALLASIACVAMANGKGGWAMLIVGLGLVFGLVWMVPRVPLLKRALPIALPLLCVAALAAVFARGMVGERIGELSLLFRSFYFEAAGRVFIDASLGRVNPAGADLPAVTSFFGTGPAGFKEAYLVYKPVLSPEDVASPHSVFFDWAATLGPLGIAWCGLLIWWLVSAGRAVGATPPVNVADTEDESAANTSEFRTLCAVATGASLLSARDVSLALTDVELIARFGGLMLWCGLGVIALKASRLRPVVVTAGAVAATAVLATHGQIEQTFAWTSSVGLIVVMIAAAGATEIARATSTPVMASSRWLAATALGGVAIASAWVGVQRVLPWQSTLESTAATVWGVRNESPQRRFASMVTAAGALARSSDWPTRREASRLLVTAARSGAPLPMAAECLRLADVVARRPIDGDAAAQAAVVALAAGSPKGGQLDAPAASTLRINQNAWLALIFETFGRDTRDRTMLARAADYAQIAARQDPTAPIHAVRLMNIYAMLGDQERAKAAAADCLKRDGCQKLDMLTRGLSDADRATASRLLGK